ncbi:hypothetical protein THASP1DRAFT_21547 [Thamnocephalis sphaerospora]|uniref:Uncharacterized protein n=1 Tax=Thamnocephalis sphaerospora TaxID=78915 RepID=A0A4P9XZ84_9FUNG|nr:hypothetical protein THASP1DRAFT_21547 [Thamnocephalis sphaerospora]|eukprot:RKP10780.1 hypothetical protein THASP1DRAFT_21547 [Thamnocephalis sphaerospora]
MERTNVTQLFHMMTRDDGAPVLRPLQFPRAYRQRYAEQESQSLGAQGSVQWDDATGLPEHYLVSRSIMNRRRIVVGALSRNYEHALWVWNANGTCHILPSEQTLDAGRPDVPWELHGRWLCATWYTTNGLFNSGRVLVNLELGRSQLVSGEGEICHIQMSVGGNDDEDCPDTDRYHAGGQSTPSASAKVGATGDAPSLVHGVATPRMPNQDRTTRTYHIADDDGTWDSFAANPALHSSQGGNASVDADEARRNAEAWLFVVTINSTLGSLCWRIVAPNFAGSDAAILPRTIFNGTSPCEHLPVRATGTYRIDDQRILLPDVVLLERNAAAALVNQPHPLAAASSVISRDLHSVPFVWEVPNAPWDAFAPAFLPELDRMVATGSGDVSVVSLTNGSVLYKLADAHIAWEPPLRLFGPLMLYCSMDGRFLLLDTTQSSGTNAADASSTVATPCLWPVGMPQPSMDAYIASTASAVMLDFSETAAFADPYRSGPSADDHYAPGSACSHYKEQNPLAKFMRDRRMRVHGSFAVNSHQLAWQYAHRWYTVDFTPKVYDS